MPASSMSNGPRVVVGVDGSPSSRAALRWAVNHAALNGGTVDAVMARQVPETDVIGGFGQTPAEVDDEKVIADDAQRSLDAIISEEVKADDRSRVRARVFRVIQPRPWSRPRTARSWSRSASAASAASLGCCSAQSATTLSTTRTAQS